MLRGAFRLSFQRFFSSPLSSPGPTPPGCSSAAAPSLNPVPSSLGSPLKPLGTECVGCLLCSSQPFVPPPSPHLTAHAHALCNKITTFVHSTFFNAVLSVTSCCEAEGNESSRCYAAVVRGVARQHNMRAMAQPDSKPLSCCFLPHARASNVATTPTRLVAHLLRHLQTHRLR